MTSIRSIIAKLDKAVQPLANTRVNDYTKFHEDVRNLVAPILLPTPLRYSSSWDVWNEADYRKVIRLDVERRLDKGQKNYGVRGRVLKLWFVPVDCELDDTIEQALLRHKLAEKRRFLADAKIASENALLEAARRRQYEADLQDEIATLAKQLEEL